MQLPPCGGPPSSPDSIAYPRRLLYLRDPPVWLGISRSARDGGGLLVPGHSPPPVRSVAVAPLSRHPLPPTHPGTARLGCAGGCTDVGPLPLVGPRALVRRRRTLERSYRGSPGKRPIEPAAS